MLSVFARLSVLLFGIVAFVAVTPRRAWAGTFDVYPVRVELSEKRGKSAWLTVTNRGKEPVRLQASAFAWSQSETGEVELGETSDIVFFPSMLTIAPGASRKLRIGTTIPIGAREQTYRLIVEELPNTQGTQANGIRILTRMSIPIFVQPESKRAGLRIENIDSRNGEIVMTVGNPGNVSLMLRQVAFVARDAAGRILFERELPGWYLLASGKRVFRLQLPGSVCSRIANATVEAKSQGDSLNARLEIPAIRCED